MSEGRLMMVSAYAHKAMTDMKLDYCDWDLAWVFSRRIHPELGECWVGNFVEGMGFIEVHFPVQYARLCTDAERQKFLGYRLHNPGVPSFRVEAGWFDPLPVSSDDTRPPSKVAGSGAGGKRG